MSEVAITGTAPRLRWGVIGCGIIANQMAQALALEGRIIDGVANRTQDKAIAFAEKYGVGRVYDSIDELIASPDIDAVYLTTPHNTHITYLRKALAAGKHVLCEKAITLNSDELDEACTLTSAARDASNSPDLGQALASLGLEPLVIPGEIEGALTFLGVAQDFPGQRILVADNGGGSTELACGTLGGGILDLTFVRSTNVGCRRLTELFLSRTNPPSKADLAEAHAFAARLFSPAIEEGGLRCDGEGAPAALVVTGGTATSLVAIRDELVPYDASHAAHQHDSDR